MMKMQKIAIILLLIRYRIKRSTTITPIKSIADAIPQGVFNYNEPSSHRQSSKTMRFLGNRKSKNKVATDNFKFVAVDSDFDVNFDLNHTLSLESEDSNNNNNNNNNATGSAPRSRGASKHQISKSYSMPFHSTLLTGNENSTSLTLKNGGASGSGSVSLGATSPHMRVSSA